MTAAGAKPIRGDNSSMPPHNDDMSLFRVTYDGPALATSEMDARELAPALLAVADLLEASTRALFDGAAKPQVNVRGSFQTGSFNIDFVLATNLLTQIKSMFASDAATAAANAIGILGALGFAAKKGFTGLIQFLKWQRDRTIKRVDVLDDRVFVTLEEDDESLEIELEVLRLLRSLAVREALDRVLAPLDKPGVDVFAVSEGDGEPVVTVRRTERMWFRAPVADDELLLDDTRKMAFSIVSLAFKEDNKWRLYDGAATIHATIADMGFLSRVDQNLISFTKGDILVCNVRVQQWQATAGARTEYTVVEVLEHRPAARQISLPGV
ncbi:hypothetical protein HDG34_005842 [Paraburkholderia sp. HC6.4b]|uniref:hypothetical protein n=1 Tax=unclassified Paraburkholderia TaxID=2615204 RepID=UPI00182F3088|nr:MULTISPECIES: hypothetical protein [unclassified Paraburkholderia]MBB5411876.1 hypothetical protein [Paraburkholderia sp. HC6.4b]MBB5450188.1 hypothetical protein [Paraburkholderia sp. Kb1A]